MIFQDLRDTHARMGTPSYLVLYLFLTKPSNHLTLWYA